VSFGRGALAIAIVASALSGCAWFRGVPEVPPTPSPPKPSTGARELEVTATAYNSVRSQTDGDPSITAYGIKLSPGMRIVAVSRDLEKMGLRRGARLTISGLEGEWTVGDRMHERWTRRIDVYMGLDEKAAREWGKRRVKIRW
jgi:3D (Asp-Asp-Asp) domain-containing protein